MKLNPLPYLLALPGTHRETLLEVQQLKSEVTLLEQILTSERADFSQSLEAAKQEASRKGIPFQEIEQDLKKGVTTRAGLSTIKFNAFFILESCQGVVTLLSDKDEKKLVGFDTLATAICPQKLILVCLLA